MKPVGNPEPRVGRAAAALLLAACAALPGCGKPPPLSKDQEGVKVKVKPWEAAGSRLRKETDASACRNTLVALNSDLVAVPEAPRPAALTKDAEDALAAVVPLNAEDLAEVRGGAFTSHDPVYLAECLYLRDAAVSLDVLPRPGETPEQAATRADLAFAWVCRQVYLNPWLLRTPEVDLATALPPTSVLRRGSGGGLERMYVFLSLLQQAGLDGCLVGPPDAGDKPAGLVAWSPDKKTVLTGTPRGPFWAVGVRIGNDVRLYDPWRGEPFPASLSQLKANPDAQKAWLEDKANVSGVTAEEAKKATTFLAVPVNSLAPRMATLEQQLKADLLAKLAVDPVALRNAFPDPKPAFWNPPKDQFAYGRAARTFLPVEFGGSNTSPPGGRMYELYVREQLPIAAFVPPAELARSADASERIRSAILGIYGVAFLGLKPPEMRELGPNPRERIQRGLFQDAARDLVARQDQYNRGLERLRNNRDAEQQLRAWVETARDLYTEQGLAATPEARELAVAAVENHWRQNSPAVQLLIDRMSADVGHAEATFLLALCRHEMAERAQARFERATAAAEKDALKAAAVEAWAASLGEWQTYAERARAHASFAGRLQAAKVLTARAEKLAAQK